jgi:hypothetical protein
MTEMRLGRSLAPSPADSLMFRAGTHLPRGWMLPARLFSSEQLDWT